jgi:hypothetical protein
MVYGVFGGEYSDWHTVGYFDNRLDADKYCAAFGACDYYVIELKDLKNEKDLSKITLKYDHEIVFDSRGNEWIMRDEPDRYKCYIAEELKPDNIRKGSFWVAFHVNIEKDDRKLAEKIAQDYLYHLFAFGNSRNVYDKYINLMNDQFIAPYKFKEKQKKEEELRQKELAELARLKEKYEANV